MKLFLGILFLNFLFAQSVFSEPAHISALVETQSIEQRTLSTGLPVYGTINPDNNAVKTLSFPIAVKISQLLVHEGEVVKKNAPILLVNTDASVKLGFQQAKAELNSTKMEYQRQTRLLDLKLSTQAAKQAALLAYSNAQSVFKIQQQQGNSQNQQKLLAPFDAVVNTIFVKPGDNVAATMPLIQIEQQGNLVAALAVDPNSSSAIKPGMLVKLHSLLNSEHTLTGKVKSVAALIDPQTRMVNVLAELDKSGAASILSGTSVEGDIITEEVSCLVVPRLAILKDKEGAYIFQVKESKAKRSSVSLGISEGQWRCIRGEFDPSLKVVVTGNYELEDGMRVREDHEVS